METSLTSTLFLGARLWPGAQAYVNPELAAGGYGFIIGDGKLNYAPETIAELYYLFQLPRFAGVSLDCQEVVHPAYNADRGPVAIFSGRVHFEL